MGSVERHIKGGVVVQSGGAICHVTRGKYTFGEPGSLPRIVDNERKTNTQGQGRAGPGGGHEKEMKRKKERDKRQERLKER